MIKILFFKLKIEDFMIQKLQKLMIAIIKSYLGTQHTLELKLLITKYILLYLNFVLVISFMI